MHRPNDTIAAIATPPGRGGVGIVRVSGPEVPSVAAAILGRVPPPRHADYRVFRDSDGLTIDHGLALYFPAPHSYTGEDVLELHGHGGPMVLDLVMQRVLALGARSARPGEFTERAFLNDKMDLVQAEAVADLIDSASHAAARSALRSLEGTFSQRIRALVERQIQLRKYVDSAGLRESTDPVESEGIQRAWREIEQADRVLLVVDDQTGVGADERALLQRLPAQPAVTVVHNKIELSGRAPGVWQDESGHHLALSAKQGDGIDLLRRHLADLMGYHGGEGAFMARRRHLDALERALSLLGHGRTALASRRAVELMADDLRVAQCCLNEITGEFGADDLLGRIFADFCIGK